MTSDASSPIPTGRSLFGSDRLGPDERLRALERMADERFDVAIVGGGVTGCGAALDAASRGLRVALVEQRDWAAGTSSRSSKLIHGGLRYLEQLDFPLVREALHEQTLLLTRVCPHLVRPVPFLYPLEHRFWERLYVGAGVWLYDHLGGERALPRHRHLSHRGALERFPGLRRDAIRGAILYYDAQVDDARHTLALARTAARHGAVLASSVRAVGFVDAGGRTAGMRVRCLETGREIAIHARRVVNATGVWTDEVQALAGRGRLRVRASKGIHLVVPRDRIASDVGLILRTEKSVLFVIPWKQHWILGTTDTDWQLDLAHPAASRADLDYLLDTVNRVLARPLGHEDIEGVYAGLRPLLHGESEATSQLSREHAVSESDTGLITVAGGKYTTYRVMARDAIDAAAAALPQRVPESCTDRLLLVGGDDWASLWSRREGLARDCGLHPNRVEHLLRRYGSEIAVLLAMLREDPGLGEPLPGAPEYLRVEARYATTHEGALHLDDVLTRRTRISVESFDRGLEAAPVVAELMGAVLGWDAATREREIAHYRARVAAERESQQQPDDQTADAARLGAPDVRMAGQQPAAEVVPLERRSP